MLFSYKWPHILFNSRLYYGEVIYEASLDFRADYEEYVMEKYLNIKHILDRFQEATLERIE